MRLHRRVDAKTRKTFLFIRLHILLHREHYIAQAPCFARVLANEYEPVDLISSTTLMGKMVVVAANAPLQIVLMSLISKR